MKHLNFLLRGEASVAVWRKQANPRERGWVKGDSFACRGYLCCVVLFPALSSSAIQIPGHRFPSRSCDDHHRDGFFQTIFPENGER